PATWNNKPEEVNGFKPESPPRSTTEQNVDLWPLTATRLEVTRYSAVFPRAEQIAFWQFEVIEERFGIWSHQFRAVDVLG
ncbi:MAG: hypothetical protein ACI8X5_003703, partial [Planctomycetota bacterium]